MTESIFWQDHEKDMTNPEYARAYYETLEEIMKMKEEA
jgi:hypothetical protein